jgi:glycosyltransferase involved in cell wall biosynthesis
MEKYVCAFRGRRDYYQIPIALAERDALEQFITDIYAVEALQKLIPTLPASWQRKIGFRSAPLIPTEKVKCLWGTTLLEHTRHKLNFSPIATFSLLDQNFSKSAAFKAQATKSNLLMYEPYAWEAFQYSYNYTPRKVLFQFHPHITSEIALLTEDLELFPYVQQSYQEQIGLHLNSFFQTRLRDCWKYANLILCASSFTRKTLIDAGADATICKVITYGIELPPPPVHLPRPDFHALFVGAGVQRKGLHHLLLAWQRANLPRGSLLTLVCRVLDPGIEDLIRQTSRVKLIRGTDQASLQQLFETSSLLVMPSIVEGFGQVYLEALSYGCPVLGTVNTCLPDLGGEMDGIFLTEVGDIDSLVTQIERLSLLLQYNAELRSQSRSCAAQFSWQAFRSQLCSFL